MEQKLKQIEQLLTLVDERDLNRLKFNRQISEMIAPTMLTAVVELLDVPTDQLEWVDVDVTDTVLVLTISVTYDPTISKSPFLGTPQNAGEAAIIQKNLRVGVPLPLVFSEPAEIIAFLRKVANIPDDDQTEERTPEASTDDTPLVSAPPVAHTQFDPSTLTKDQIQQMLYFQHLSQGKKQ